MGKYSCRNNILIITNNKLTSQMSNVIECKNLTHYYGERCIYENLNFTVQKGRVTGLLGKNGTGKTTTINIMNGYLQPKSGNCFLLGEPSHNLSPETKQRIGLLIEGHVQYSFFDIEQIEKFYSAFYPKWKKEPYYELMSKLKVAPKQKISKMSCGQRSQVALGLILAQDPELLILDDFSMGLDPGYRMLFVDYLREYVKAENKSVFITSHIIQDLEHLVDDCLILDYGKVLLHKPTSDLLTQFKRYRFKAPKNFKIQNEQFYNTELIKGMIETYSFLNKKEVLNYIKDLYPEIETIDEYKLTLEEAFIGLTGKY